MGKLESAPCKLTYHHPACGKGHFLGWRNLGHRRANTRKQCGVCGAGKTAKKATGMVVPCGPSQLSILNCGLNFNAGQWPPVQGSEQCVKLLLGYKVKHCQNCQKKICSARGGKGSHKDIITLPADKRDCKDYLAKMARLYTYEKVKRDLARKSTERTAKNLDRCLKMCSNSKQEPALEPLVSQWLSPSHLQCFQDAQAKRAFMAHSLLSPQSPV